VGGQHQRPRGRYAYALTKSARVGLERLIWPDGRPELRNGVEVTAPVIHQLATHDLLAAFLRGAAPGSEAGLAAWVPERACLRLFEGWLRPDAVAVVRAAQQMIVLFVERDLGAERGGVVPEKVHRYRSAFSRSTEPPIHLGIVVDSARRAASLGRGISRTDHSHGPIQVWLAAWDGLARDPLHATWTSPAGDRVRTVDLAPHWTGDPWPPLVPGCLAQPDGLEGLDERVFEAIPALTPFAR
jgi:hypothetical protein